MVSSIYNPNTLTANCYNPELCRANLTGVRKNPSRSMSDGLDEWQISGRSLISRSVDASDQTTLALTEKHSLVTSQSHASKDMERWAI